MSVAHACDWRRAVASKTNECPLSSVMMFILNYVHDTLWYEEESRRRCVAFKVLQLWLIPAPCTQTKRKCVCVCVCVCVCDGAFSPRAAHWNPDRQTDTEQMQETSATVSACSLIACMSTCTDTNLSRRYAIPFISRWISFRSIIHAQKNAKEKERGLIAWNRRWMTFSDRHERKKEEIEANWPTCCLEKRAMSACGPF